MEVEGIDIALVILVDEEEKVDTARLVDFHVEEEASDADSTVDIAVVDGSKIDPSQDKTVVAADCHSRPLIEVRE
jgi:hypothetical protein